MAIIFVIYTSTLGMPPQPSTVVPILRLHQSCVAARRMHSPCSAAIRSSAAADSIRKLPQFRVILYISISRK